MDIEAIQVPKSGPAILDNNNVLTRARHAIALAAGATAGVLQLESFYGFGVFVAAMALASVALFALTAGSNKQVLYTGVLASLPGFVLSWVLVYSLSA